MATIKTLAGDTTEIANDDVEALAAGLRGSIARPGDPGYEEARTIWNAMIDRRPGLVVRCRGASDVVQAVRFARQHDLLVAIRGGGHNIAGKAVCDGGLLIDLSPMKGIHVDPDARCARVEPGNSLGDLDRETQLFGLATPTGINSTTGIAGLTLGGGFGWLSRKHGLTVDNLLSADVVTPDGEIVRASEFENPDLFWAIRGGGGNFGVVTSFEFELHPVGPEVLSGLVVHRFDDAPEVLDFYRDFVEEMPDELNVWFVLRKAPPLPFLPEEIHGEPIVILACFYAGDMDEGERLLQPLGAFGDRVADVVGPHPYAGWQAAFDPLLEPGARNYWKSHNFTEIEDGALDAMMKYTESLPSPLSEIFVARLGGEQARRPIESTPYPHRDAEFLMNVHTRWEDPADDERCVTWAREFFDATAPFATGGTYVNFLTEDEAERVPDDAYGANYARLAEIKAKYDPDNRFRLNQNVKPAAGVAAAD
ncbi:MAG: FAD-binding oxidoreductase [Gemmatimonadetes bacterium]|nr:FAD-binding oxidoreductase [Gemmatimonadota bacterium]